MTRGIIDIESGKGLKDTKGEQFEPRQAHRHSRSRAASPTRESGWRDGPQGRVLEIVGGGARQLADAIGYADEPSGHVGGRET